MNAKAKQRTSCGDWLGRRVARFGVDVAPAADVPVQRGEHDQWVALATGEQRGVPLDRLAEALRA